MSSEAPDSLIEISLKDAVEFIVDNRGKTAPTTPSGIALIATNCVNNVDLYPQKLNLRYVSQETYNSWFRAHPVPGDILLTNKGSQNGAICLVPNPVDFCIAQDMVALRANSKKISPLYLFAALRSDLVQKRIKALNVDAVIPHLKKTDFNKLLIPLPDRKVQDSVGELYFELSSRIELLRETNATLEAIAQALFKSWFVDFDPVRAKLEGRAPDGMDEATARLFPDSFEESELGLVPKGWRAKPIGEVCTLGRGSSPRPIQNFMGDDIPWIKIADATASDGMFVFKTKEKIKREGASKSTAVGHGDLIMSNSASCGIPVFVELEGCIHDGWLYFKNFKGVSKILMFHWLRNISDHLVHIADGSVQKNLNIGLVSSQLIICPGNPVLSSFDALSKPLLERMRENCLQAQTLATLRDTLLPRLISGQLRLPEEQNRLEESAA